MESLALRMRHRLDDASTGLTGSVCIGTPEGFGTYFLAPRIAQVSAAHPNLEIKLIANPRMFSLSKREADLAMSMTRPAQGRVYAHKLTDYSLGVYASKIDYLDTHRKIGMRRDLLAHPWIGYVEDQMWSAELNYLPQISTLVPTIRISNVISQATAVSGGVGLGGLPCFIVRTDPGLVRLFRDQIALARSYWLVTLAETRDIARVRLLADFIREECSGDWFLHD